MDRSKKYKSRGKKEPNGMEQQQISNRSSRSRSGGGDWGKWRDSRSREGEGWSGEREGTRKTRKRIRTRSKENELFTRGWQCLRVMTVMTMMRVMMRTKKPMIIPMWT